MARPTHAPTTIAAKHVQVNDRIRWRGIKMLVVNVHKSGHDERVGLELVPPSNEIAQVRDDCTFIVWYAPSTRIETEVSW